MLEIKSLTTGISLSKILHSNLNFNLLPGEMMLLVGTNGIGKSILLKTLLGHLNPISGSVIWKNKNLHQLSNSSRSALTSLMLATPPTIEYMSGFDVAITGRQRFLSHWDQYHGEHEKKVLEIANQFNIENLLTKRFSQMSDGEKQKIMFVRCLLQESPIILLDEPLAFLDYPSKFHFLIQLHQYCKSTGTIAVISSHEIELCQKYCNKLLWLKQHAMSEWFDEPQLFKPEVWIQQEY
jgi:iron complex transport system ATP-binding protein